MLTTLTMSHVESIDDQLMAVQKWQLIISPPPALLFLYLL